MMRRLSAFLLLLLALAAGAEVKVTGGRFAPVAVDPPKNSGVDQVVVLYSPAEAVVTYTAASASADVDWRRYDSYGEAYAKPVGDTERNGRTITLRAPRADQGYIITEGARRTVVWLADYSAHPFDARAIAVDAAESDCSSLTLLFEGSAPQLNGYGPTGRAFEIDRDIRLQWNTMLWSDDKDSFVTDAATATRPWLPARFTIAAPLCRTAVTMAGDRFLRAWDMEQTLDTEYVDPTAVEAHTTATQTERDAPNEQKIEGVELGGSAPVEITFSARVTPAALFTEWQMAQDAEFDVIDFRSSDTDMSYTFTEMGTTYVRFVAANADASCDFYSDTYIVTVGESSLIIPNAFSPGASEGVNDEWRVSYKSLVKFQCHIFNKWGEKMAEFDDPSRGWDGRYRGKLVPAGVYYYVIEATGSDGRRYKRAGDINIVNHR